MQESYNSFRTAILNPTEGKVSIARGKGIVSSVSKWASRLGCEVLSDGGNAFDAAFAVGFGLALYHPQAGNLGGGGYLLFHKRGWSRPHAIDYREKAPSRVKRELYLDKEGKVDPERTAFGPLSVCIPGTVKALFLLHERYGVLRYSDILGKLSQYAENGYPVSNYQVQCLNRLASKLATSKDSRSIYVKEHPWITGDIFYNQKLAKTYRILAREGEKSFYRGEIAEGIVKDLEEHGGIVRAEDLKNYEVKEVEPIDVEIDGHRVWSVPPEGGGAVPLNILAILEMGKLSGNHNSRLQHLHYLLQASKIAFINRIYYLGDISLTGNKVYETLYSKKKLEEAFYLINPERDTPTESIHHSLFKDEDRVVINSLNNGETTHFTIMDADGNTVSNSYTLNLRYGSKWSVEGYGFLLNGSIDAFSFFPGMMNYFGIPGGIPNLIAPGKRPASSMAPMMVMRNAEVVAALGTPGGPMIATTLALLLFLVLKQKHNPIEAMKLTRIHHQAWPDTLFIENRDRAEDKRLIRQFTNMGYTIHYKEEPIADIHGIFFINGSYIGISDYRREGASLAV